MRRGRKPKPTRLKLLQGNPGKRPIERDALEPPVEIPPCPEHLNPHFPNEPVIWRHRSVILV